MDGFVEMQFGFIKPVTKMIREAPRGLWNKGRWLLPIRKSDGQASFQSKMTKAESP